MVFNPIEALLVIFLYVLGGLVIISLISLIAGSNKYLGPLIFAGFFCFIIAASINPEIMGLNRKFDLTPPAALRLFCKKAQQNRPIFYAEYYKVLSQPTNVLMRYGDMLSDHSGSPSQPHLPDAFIQTLNSPHPYPSIRCFEGQAANYDNNLSLPSRICQNEGNYVTSRSPHSDTSQARFHLIIGEDDSEHVIREVAGTSYWRKSDGNHDSLRMELHTARMIDTHTGKTVASMPFVVSNSRSLGLNPRDFGCTDQFNAAQYVLEHVLIPPTQRLPPIQAID